MQKIKSVLGIGQICAKHTEASMDERSDRVVLREESTIIRSAKLDVASVFRRTTVVEVSTTQLPCATKNIFNISTLKSTNGFRIRC